MSDCSTTGIVGKYNLPTIPLGADVSFPISYKPGGTLVDLSTYTAKLQVRKTYGSPVLVELSTADSSIVLAAIAPNSVLWFLKEKTEDLTITEGMQYDLEITSGSGIVTRVLEGSFSVSKQITV